MPSWKGLAPHWVSEHATLQERYDALNRSVVLTDLKCGGESVTRGTANRGRLACGARGVLACGARLVGAPCDSSPTGARGCRAPAGEHLRPSPEMEDKEGNADSHGG